MRKQKETKKALAKRLGIPTSTLYYKSKKENKDWLLKGDIELVLRDNPSYGYRRVATGLEINKKRIQRVMAKYGIKARRRRTKKWKKKAKIKVIYPNLILFTKPEYKGHIWASDFTYLYYKGKWYYLATIIDLYTREILGFSVSTKHDRWLVMEALTMALNYHRRPVIHHSDQGSEYRSKDYTDILKNVGTLVSMSHPGCPWENGYQESFYGKFKLDLGDPERFESLGEFIYNIYKTIYYYNTSRIHSKLNMAPKAFARQTLLEKSVHKGS